MAVRSLPPSAILLQTNLAGSLADVDEDPDNPDAAWLTAISVGTDTDLRVSFDTPSVSPLAGAGLQEFRVRVRKVGAAAPIPTAQIFLFEDGVQRAVGPSTPVANGPGTVLSFTWNASLLTDATGAGVECRVFGDSVQVDAIEAVVEDGALEWLVRISVDPNGRVGFSGRSSGARAGISSNRGHLGAHGRATGVVFIPSRLLSGAFGAHGSATGVKVSGAVVLITGHLGLRAASTGTKTACPPGTESLSPDAILELSNLSGTLDRVQDDPDFPDAAWLTADLPLIGTAARFSFPTPTEPPLAGATFDFSPSIIDSFQRPDIPCAPGVTPVITDTGEPWVSGAGGIGISSGAAVMCVAGDPFATNIATVAGPAVDRGVRSRITLSPTVGPFGNRVNIGILLARQGNDVVRVRAAVANEPTGTRIVLSFAGVAGLSDVTVPASDLLPGSTHDLEAQLTPTSIVVLVDDVVRITQPLTQPQHDTIEAAANIGLIGFRDAGGVEDVDDGLSRWEDFSAGPLVVSSGGAQEFRVLVRSTFLLEVPPLLFPPTARIELWENGVPLAQSQEFPVSGETLLFFAWDATLLADATGAGVEVLIVGTASILDLVGWTVEIGAVEWNLPGFGSCALAGSLGFVGTAIGSKVIVADASFGTLGFSALCAGAIAVSSDLFGAFGARGRVRPPMPSLLPDFRRCPVEIPSTLRGCLVEVPTTRRRC